MLDHIKTGLQQSPVQRSLTLKYNPKNSSNEEESNDEIFVLESSFNGIL